MASPEGQSSFSVRFRVAVTLGPTFRTVELSGRIGADLRYPLPNAVALVFPSPHRSLHHDVGAFRQSPSVLGQLAEGISYVELA